MGLNLEWEWNGGHGVATAGGLRLVVRNCYHPVTWQIRSGAGVGVEAREVEVIDDDWRAATLAAQEAAESAAARLLAEDAGVRALVSLIGDALTTTLADEPLRGLVDFIAVHVERDALRAKVAELEASMRWIPVAERLPDAYTERVMVCHENGYMASRAWMPSEHHALGVWAMSSGATSAVAPSDHWRPLGAGPEVGQ